MSGVGVPFRKLCARQELALMREYPRLIPRLIGWGLSAQDAQAVAWNCTLLSRVLAVEPPMKTARAVLETYSLEEIADLCEEYRQVAAGRLEYGGREEAG